MTDPEKPWKPLLEGEDAAKALAIVREIAEALRDDAKVEDPSLASGKAGIALFFGYLHKAFPNEGWDEVGLRYLQGAIDAVPQLGGYFALYGGITGIAWATEHLQGILYEPDEEDANAEIDEALSLLVAQSPWAGDYDLVSGLVGYGIYACERLPRPKARQILESIVARLDETAEKRDGLVSWFTPPGRLPEHQRKEAPQGYYNLGMAHGVPGVVSLLAFLVDAGIARERALPLLEGSVRWILKQQLANSPGASFPFWVGPGITPQPSRTAWCYGDPGVVVALLQAGKVLRDETLIAEATRLALACATRPVEKAELVDAGICHGAAGVAFILGQLRQEAVNSSLQPWFHYVFNARKSDGGVAGFMAWSPSRGDAQNWSAESGSLVGASGIGSALLCSLGKSSDGWSRFLGLFFPEQ